MNLDWLVGFIEGEGCFSTSIYKDKTGTSLSGIYICPSFQLAVNVKDKEVIKKIQKFLKQRDINSHVRLRQCNNSKQVCLDISSLKNCIKFANLINNKLESNKRLDFDVWNEILITMRNKKHFSRKGIKHIWNLRSQIKKRKGRKRSMVEVDIDNISFRKRKPRNIF